MISKASQPLGLELTGLLLVLIFRGSAPPGGSEGTQAAIAWEKDIGVNTKPDDLPRIEGQGIRQLTLGEATDGLLFLGCAWAYDDRNRKAAQAFMRLLQSAGVDFVVLGAEESCCGDTARRLRNEYLFQILAEQNIETLEQLSFNRLVPPYPHCFNTLKNEYPQLSGNDQVQHYAEILTELMPLLPANMEDGAEAYGRVAYHALCYFCRYNQVYDAPRQRLDQAGVHRMKMPRQGAEGFCCGEGGGQMWLESEAETRINNRADRFWALLIMVWRRCHENAMDT